MRVVRWSVLVALLALVCVVLVIDRFAAVNAQGVIGAPASGKNAIEFIGRTDQDGTLLTSYGYLMHINGLDDSLLFSTPLTHTASTAYFTYYFTSTITSRDVLSSVFTTSSVGTFAVYHLDTPGASFDDPASFAKGQTIATASVRSRSVINVIAPNFGILSGVSDLVHETATPFTAGGQSFQLGLPGLTSRSIVTGQGIRTDPVIPRANYTATGYIVATNRSKVLLPLTNNGGSAP